MRVEAGSATHVGRVRRDNEDACLLGRRVWAVADGMGGHAAGEVASALAVGALRPLDESPDEPTEAAVIEAVAAANTAVLAHGRAHPTARGLGTTLVGAALVGGADTPRLCVFNVGDSRAYLVEGEALRQISTDHSEIGELVALGLISDAEARNHPLRHIVTRCVGMPGPIVPDTWMLDPPPGSRLLLCSDGLSGELDDDAIAARLRSGTAQEVADDLVAAAVAAGGHDNVTVIVLDIAAGD